MSDLAKSEVLPICNCQKSNILDLECFEMRHFQVIWPENSHVIKITKESLTFEKKTYL